MNGRRLASQNSEGCCRNRILDISVGFLRQQIILIRERFSAKAEQIFFALVLIAIALMLVAEQPLL